MAWRLGRSLVEVSIKPEGAHLGYATHTPGTMGLEDIPKTLNDMTIPIHGRVRDVYKTDGIILLAGREAESCSASSRPATTPSPALPHPRRRRGHGAPRLHARSRCPPGAESAYLMEPLADELLKHRVLSARTRPPSSPLTGESPMPTLRKTKEDATGAPFERDKLYEPLVPYTQGHAVYKVNSHHERVHGSAQRLPLSRTAEHSLCTGGPFQRDLLEFGSQFPMASRYGCRKLVCQLSSSKVA